MARRSVLVTRPEGRGETLSRCLREAGCTVLEQPLINIQPLPLSKPEDRQRVQDLDLYQHLIFVSLNAVDCGMAWIEQYWPQLPAGLNWYAVGQSSAARLSDYGLRVRQPEQRMDSEGLLALPQFQQVNGERVLIVRGAGGRPLMGETLVERGARVDYLECYERACPDLAAGDLAARMDVAAVDSILLGSGEALDNLVRLLSMDERNNVMDMLLVLPSERVAQRARSLGFRHLQVAANATDEAMVAALMSARRNPESNA